MCENEKENHEKCNGSASAQRVFFFSQGPKSPEKLGVCGGGGDFSFLIESVGNYHCQIIRLELGVIVFVNCWLLLAKRDEHQSSTGR